jgi:hypothetical protein
VHIAREEILRLLGAAGGKRPLRDDTLKMVRETEALGLALVRPLGVYRILEGHALQKSPHLRGHNLVALGLCTIGPQLEDEVKQLMATGREPEGYILDAVGSVATEATADAINARICHWAAAHDLVASPRFSPGYGSWRLEEQRIIFALLPAETIGMSLNPSCMMIPRKSVSFAVIFTKDAVDTRPKNPCERCGLVNCPFRKM